MENQPYLVLNVNHPNIKEISESIKSQENILSKNLQIIPELLEQVQLLKKRVHDMECIIFYLVPNLEASMEKGGEFTFPSDNSKWLKAVENAKRF